MTLGRRKKVGGHYKMDIAQPLMSSAKNKASDLHLSAGLPLMIRIHGDMRRINAPPLTHQDVHSMAYDIMSDGQRKVYEKDLKVDFSFEVSSLSRLRINVFNQNRGASAMFRTIPSEVLSLDDLKAPAMFADLIMKPRGLVLVTGPTGSGKSTTLTAMVNHHNENDMGHTPMVKDPIEFMHESKEDLINQRELRPHTHSLANALKSALREDPDVALVGELRDLETIRLALTAAKTGHLVFGMLHTSSAARTINRVVNVLLSDEKEIARTMFSELLETVISQTLFKTCDGLGWTAAYEIMIVTSAIRHLIHENKTSQMYSMMQTSSGMGMQTLDQCLSEPIKRSAIDYVDARAIAKNPDAFVN